MRRDLWKYLIVVLAAVAPVELASLAAGRVLAARGFFYVSPGTSGYDGYLSRRDPLLGWPAPSAIGQGEFDSAGSRVVPRFPDPTVQPTCVALFGDSFTWGDEVVPEQAWGNVLAGHLGCRVGNYGVPGYGTDQAFLRFKHRIRDGARIVVLGHWSEDIIRNVNRYRGFLVPNPFGLKPRFVTEADGRLELLPLPLLDAQEFAALGGRPELIPHEYFHPGGPSGVTRLRFPYLLSILRLTSNYRLRAWIQGRPAYAEFYDPDHPSGALTVTLDILKAFEREARTRGQHPVVVLIPDLKDLHELRSSARLPYGVLADRLEESGIPTPDVAARMLEYLGDRDPCALFTNCDRGHYNPVGYQRLARIVYDWMRERSLLELL
jgi:hypothetical protein